MKQFWTKLRGWFAGKKTYLGGGAVIAAALAGAFTGHLSITDAVAVAGVGLSVCGLGAKADRNHSQIVTALTAVAAAGADVRLGNKAAVLADLKPLETVAEQETIQAVTGA